jgi:FKBP-type peptidyl-prolyl cis-trans isomerase FkpA
MKFVCSLLLLFFAFSSCKKNNQSQAEKDDEAIKQYISDHGLNATATGTGLYVVIENPGSGQSCNAYSNVKVSYKGYYTNGDVFDQSSTSGVTFNLQNVIKGWTEGIPHFKKTGNGILLIPSSLGYGKNGSGSVPANSVLIFDVKLVDVL